MIYIFRIYPVVRFLVACVFGFTAWMSFKMVFVIHSLSGQLLAFTQGVVYLLIALFILPVLGRILRAYSSTWKWR